MKLKEAQTKPKQKGAKKMNITYRQQGDYQLPELTLTADQPNIGKYGMLRKTFLKNHRKAFYSTLMLTGKLMEHLAEIDQMAQNMMEQLTTEMEQKAGLTEAMKAKDQMTWVGIKNNIRQAAEEQILNDLIYN